MAKKIKVRCHPNEHVNEVDLQKVLRKDIVLKGRQAVSADAIPERIVLRCTECADGKVILTKKMVEENLQD